MTSSLVQNRSASRRSPNMSSALGIRSTFSVHGEVVHRFQSGTKLSLNEPSGSAGGDAKSEEQEKAVGGQSDTLLTVDEKFDHRYTGRHDHGLLPALKSGGPHGELLQSLLDAKEDSNAFLTGLIAEEQQSKRGDQNQPIGLPKSGPKDSGKSTTTPDTKSKEVASASQPEHEQPTKRPRP